MSPIFKVDVDFEVWCSCGEGLCNQTSVDGESITVEPCKVCQESAKDEGHEEGSRQGFDKGHDEGYQEGYEQGRDAAMKEAS